MKARKQIKDDPLEADFKQTASGLLKPLLPAHKIIYRALRAANLTFNRVVSVSELVEFLTPSENDRLSELHPKLPYDIAGKILPLLVARGIVFTPGKTGSRCYYGATSIMDSNTAQMPQRKSRRERVRDVVREAVETAERALRVEELWKYAERTGDLKEFTTQMFTHDVLSLLQTGDLKRLRTVRGEGKGYNLYLPAEFDESLYTPTEPLSWLEEVTEAFNIVWQRHIAEAEIKGRKPFAVSTGEVRAQWLKMPNPHPKACQSLTVVNAMGLLSAGAQHEPPKIRKIKREGERYLLWSPISFIDEMLDSEIVYLSDSERIEVAVKRAVSNAGRPVTLMDIKDEIDLDPALHPTGKAEIRKVLMETAKEFVGGGNQERSIKKFQRIHHVGMLNNEAYFYHGKSQLDEAYSYVQSLVMESEWSELSFESRFGQINSSPLFGIALGNVKLLIAECQDLTQRIELLLTNKLDDHSKARMVDLLGTVLRTLKQVKRAAKEFALIAPSVLPDKIDTIIHGVTGEDLANLLTPLHHRIDSDLPSEKVITLLWKYIRHFPNPDYKNRFMSDARQAAGFLFDRADALMYAGTKWGGQECAFQARTARHELGRLRDARFVIPGLKEND